MILTIKHIKRILASLTIITLTSPLVWAEDKYEELDTVVVIGEKSNKTLNESTSSVTVIPDYTLDTMQHQTISDAISGLANVVVQSGSVPNIRGVSGNGAAGGFNSITGGANARVSTLIDGVAEPFVADLTGDSGIWDIEQIEVYRGPQSTINGRNSIGGSIFIKTKDPTFDWEAAARIGYRNKENYIDKSVMLSGPIMKDTLAFRITAQVLDAQTLTDTTEFATNPADYDLNEIATKRFKGKLLWKPTDDLTALLSYSTNNEQGDTGRIYYTADDPYEYNRAYFRDVTTKSETTSLKVNYKINDSMSFDVLTAVMDYEFGFDGYESTVAKQQQLVFEDRNYTLDAKFNFGENNDMLNGFVGLAYYQRKQDFNSLGATIYTGDDKSHSEAVYGELNYGLTNKLAVITGGRLQKEEQNRNFVYGPVDADLVEKNTIFLPKLVFQYDLTDDTTVSIGGRKGYNSGGGALNFTAREYYYYEEEEVNTYELTLRSKFANTNVAANVFYNEYKGYQALSSTRAIVNMEDVATSGAELSLNSKLTQKLQANASLGLLYTKIKDAGINYTNATGNELNSAPDLTASLGLTYWVTNAFDVGATANYISEYYSSINNDKEYVAGDYTVVRLNANYEKDNWRVSAFVNNLFDEKGYTYAEGPSGTAPAGLAAIVAPRNMGLSLTYTY